MCFLQPPRRPHVIFRRIFRKWFYGMPACAPLRYVQAREHRRTSGGGRSVTSGEVVEKLSMRSASRQALAYSKHTETRTATKKQQLTKHALILDMAIFRSSQNVFFFFPGFFVVFPVWNTLKHIEIWYRILWIDLIWAPEMKYELEATWYGRFLSKLVIQMVRWHQKMLWKYGFSWVWWVCQLGFTIKMRWYGAIFEGGTSTPFGPTVRFSVIAGFVASSIGPDGLHHPVQSNCGLWGGVGSLCDDFPDDKGVFLFSQSHSSTCKTHDRPIYELKVHELIIQS